RTSRRLSVRARNSTPGAAPPRSRTGSRRCRMRQTPGTSMRAARSVILAILLASVLVARASAQTEQAVEIVTDSTPTRCAEEDNVYLKLQAEQVRRFRIEARHPAYIGTIVADRWAPDFTNCTMAGSADHKFERRRLTLYETEDWQLVGLTFPSF